METRRQCLLFYHQTQMAEFQYQFHRAETELGEGPIHDLRVNLKKIRTLFKLIQYLDSDFNLKSNFCLFRRIFKEAGLIRDIQVQIELMTAFSKPRNHQFKSYLHDLETEGKIRFRQKLVETNLDELAPIDGAIEAAVARIQEPGLNGRIVDFIIQRIESAARSFHEGTSIDSMHHSRILLKDAYYMLQMLQEFEVQTGPLALLLERVDQLQDTFGTWHDWEVALHHLDDYLVHRSGA